VLDAAKTWLGKPYAEVTTLPAPAESEAPKGKEVEK
jgi:hypothetical protein